jgi:hypothetical protein
MVTEGTTEGDMEAPDSIAEYHKHLKAEQVSGPNYELSL